MPQKLEVESSPMSVYDLICSSTKGPAVFYRKSKKKYEEIKSHLKEFGADKLIDKRVCDLSGGELQRVLIAMATMPYPELLIMDEPVSGIDAKGKKEFYKLIKKIKEKRMKDIELQFTKMVKLFLLYYILSPSLHHPHFKFIHKLF